MAVLILLLILAPWAGPEPTELKPEVLEGARVHATKALELADADSVIVNFGANTALVDSVMHTMDPSVPIVYVPVSEAMKAKDIRTYLKQILPKAQKGQNLIVNRAIMHGYTIKKLAPHLNGALSDLGWIDIQYFFVGSQARASTEIEESLLMNRSIRVKVHYEQIPIYGYTVPETRWYTFWKEYGGWFSPPETKAPGGPDTLSARVLEGLVQDLCD